MIDRVLPSIGPAAVILGVLVLMVIIIAWRAQRSHGLLAHWAEENGYQILRQEHRLLRRGPYFFSATSDQAVYYVVVTDHFGRERRGYVRLGGWLLGLFSNQVDVQWED
jgi:hypothetical protein